MMGRTHAVSGTAAWLAAYPTLDGLIGLTPGQTVAGCALTAGAAMLPDVDAGGFYLKRHGIIWWPHAWGSSISRTYGWLTAGLSAIIRFLAGGEHRRGTHAAIGVAAFTALATIPGITGTVYAWLLLGVAIRALDVALPGKFSNGPISHGVLIAVILAVLTVAGVNLEPILPGTVALGCSAHIVGDMLTEHGCPLLWPFTKRRFRLASLPLDGKGETWIRRGLIVASCWFAVAAIS